MGYTHYWNAPNQRLGNEVMKDITDVLTRYKGIIQREHDNDGQSVLGDNLIVFNGIGDEGYETFWFVLGERDFCKTERKPYDIVVCEVLLLLKAYYGESLELSSDGFWVSEEEFNQEILDGKWNEAIANVKSHYGIEFNFIPNVEEPHGRNYYSFKLTNKAGGYDV